MCEVTIRKLALILGCCQIAKPNSSPSILEKCIGLLSPFENVRADSLPISRLPVTNAIEREFVVRMELQYPWNQWQREATTGTSRAGRHLP